jgi:hypothetical protein
MRVFGTSVTELVAGFLVAAVGLAVLLAAMPLSMGTARAMGPGFVPVSMGIILILLGAGIVFVEGRRGIAERPEMPALRPLIFIPAAVIVFAVTVQRFGMIPSVFLTTFISTLADPASPLVRSLIVAAVLAVLAQLVFGWGLGFQVRAWTW